MSDVMHIGMKILETLYINRQAIEDDFVHA